jgi:hypothetical protein
MTGTASIAAFLPFASHPGRASCGRFQSSPSMTTINKGSARNGKYPLEPGRLVNDHLMIH